MLAVVESPGHVDLSLPPKPVRWPVLLGLHLAGKLGLGVGTMISGLALDAIAFPLDGNLSAHVIPDATLAKLGLVFGPAAGGFTLAAITIALGYKLTRERHATIVNELMEKRTE